MSRLGERVQRFEQALSAARRRLDREAVHQLRVSIRRLQAALRLMGLHEERRSLRPLMQLAGEVRNRDIAIALAGARPVRAALQQERRRQAGALKQALQTFTPPIAAGTLPKLVEETVQCPPHLLADFFRAGRRALRKPTAKRLHALRLAGKRLRYAIEFLAPELDATAPARLKELKRAQDELGEANDCATTRLLTQDPDFHADLLAREQEHRERFLQDWRESFGVLGAWESWSLFLRPVTPLDSRRP